MKNWLLALICLYLGFTVEGQTNSANYDPHEVVLKFSPDATQADRQSLIQQLGSLLQNNSLGTPTIAGEVLVHVPEYPVIVDGEIYQSPVELIGRINTQHARVDGASFNYQLAMPSNTFNARLGQDGFVDYSPLSNNCEQNYPGGQLKGKPLSPNGGSVSVGVLDTGLDPYYSTINDYITGEVNVLSDDNDITIPIQVSSSYDPNNPITMDRNGHGTAVTGILAGLSKRADITPRQLSIVIIKCFDDNGVGYLFNMIQAITIAEELGLDIINLSWSYMPDITDPIAHELEQLLVDFTTNDNRMIVAGAGNDARNLHDIDLAPAGLEDVNNMLVVGGSTGEEADCDGDLADFSNYGVLVDIAAPGSYLTVPGLGGYWSTDASGTSFAAPIVTAAAVQVWLHYQQSQVLPLNRTVPASLICASIENSATWVPALQRYFIDGVVNFQTATEFVGSLYQDQPSLPGSVLPPTIKHSIPAEEPSLLTAEMKIKIVDNVMHLLPSHEVREVPETYYLYSLTGHLLSSGSLKWHGGLTKLRFPWPSGSYALLLESASETKSMMVFKP